MHDWSTFNSRITYGSMYNRFLRFSRLSNATLLMLMLIVKVVTSVAERLVHF